MKIIIAGSRDITHPGIVDVAVKGSGFTVTEVVSGGARGVDQLGEAWATRAKIAMTQIPADWEAHGRRAGVMRNAAMADYAEALIAIWDGESRGTAHMIETARRKGLPIYVHLYHGGTL